jgi:hypothetical protein
MDHSGQIADQFDLQSPVGARLKGDRIDQRADDFDCFCACGPIGEELVELGHFLPIDLSKVGMKPYRLDWRPLELGRNLPLSCFKRL